MRIILLFCLTLNIFSSETFAQEDSLKKKINLGITFSNLIDVNEGQIIQENGYIDNDLAGFNGNYTSFDKSFGIDIGFYIGKRGEFIFDFHKGKITAQNDNQYLRTDLLNGNFLYRLYLNKNSKQAFPQFFVQPGIGISVFDSRRYFILDEGLFSQISDKCLTNSLFIGTEINFNKVISFSIQTGGVINYNDGFDGYDNGGLGDVLIHSSVGIHFAL